MISFTFFFFFTIFSLDYALCYAAPSLYSDHCSSIVPESTPKVHHTLSFPLSAYRNHHGYYSSGNGINFNQNSYCFSKSLVFTTQSAYTTDIEGVLQVWASLGFDMPIRHDRNFTNREFHQARITSGKSDWIKLFLEGFWSESSGKLCMIGYTAVFTVVNKKINSTLIPGAVLKLDNIKNSSTVTTLINGTLESLRSTDDPDYFETISVLMLPQVGMNYQYTLVSEELNDHGLSNGGDNANSLPLSSLPQGSLCIPSWWNPEGFNLKFASSCKSAKNCGPFGIYSEYAPQIIVSGFSCLDEKQRLHVLVELSKNGSNGFLRPFYPDTTLIGEGYWDDKKLSIVACRFFNVTESLVSACVADCSIRLNLWFPAILSIRETSYVVGQIWTNKTVDDSGYFYRIMLQSSGNHQKLRIPGLKYKYTEIDRVRKLCTETQPVKNNEELFPVGNSMEMIFDMTVSGSSEGTSSGYAIPFSVGDELYYDQLFNQDHIIMPRDYEDYASFRESSGVNISYKIVIELPKSSKESSLFTRSLIFDGKVGISAEGIYNDKTGSLCMVGCRNLDMNDWIFTTDCEILLKFQFPPLNSKKNENYINGTIESTREESDPVYFKPLEVSGAAYTKLRANYFEE